MILELLLLIIFILVLLGGIITTCVCIASKVSKLDEEYIRDYINNKKKEDW